MASYSWGWNLARYFPDYKPNQMPERRFMYSILTTFRFDEVSAMVKNARENKALQNSADDDILVHIEKNLYKEIQSVMAQKCKLEQ